MSQLKEGMFSSNSSNQTNVFSTSLTFAGNLGHLTWVRHSSRKSSAARSYQHVWYFHVSKQWYGCQCLGFLSCVQVLMNAVARRGCTDTVRVCTGSWPGQKCLAIPGTQTCISIVPGFSSKRSTSWAISAPLYIDKYVFYLFVAVCLLWPEAASQWYVGRGLTCICVTALAAWLGAASQGNVGQGLTCVSTWGSITMECWSGTNLRLNLGQHHNGMLVGD